jgi:N6-L-threonylcarbamoyladenine synthase
LSHEDTIILGIESSCDDTSAAILKNDNILSNIVAGQKVHEAFGGVVPELASRAHQQNILPVVSQALKEANITFKDLDCIAFTKGPGLLGSLVVGTSFSKGLALGLDIPLIGVNHMHGHILAHLINDDGMEKPNFPFLCLTVSGGHTQIIKVVSPTNMTIIGQTKDDAAGEAFDKAAKILGLPYPGGPLIDKYAKLGNPKKYPFPIPNVDGYDFSFSGFKTSVLYFLQKEMKKDDQFINENLNDICASIQYTIVKILLKKFIKASTELNIKELAIAGGVSANSHLRDELNKMKENGYKIHIPKFEYCTDNAAMIAIAGYYKFKDGIFEDQSVIPSARLAFDV